MLVIKKETKILSTITEFWIYLEDHLDHHEHKVYVELSKLDPLNPQVKTCSEKENIKVHT